MHNLGCPKRNNPYGDCECAAMEQREHTEQLRRFNDNYEQRDRNGTSDELPIKSLMAIKELIIKGEYSDERVLELIAEGLK